MKPKLRIFGKRLVYALYARSKKIAHRINTERSPKMSSTKSEIESLWELGEFESLAALTPQSPTKTETNLIREANSALNLLQHPSLQAETPGRKIAADESFKTVTILHSSLPHHPGGYSNRAQGLLKGISAHGVELVGYTRPGFYRERVDKNAAAPFPTDSVDGITYHHLSDTVRRGRGEFQYMESCIEIYKEVFQHESPQVVHVRSTYLIALPAIIAAKSLGIPVVYEVSGLWELVFEGRGEVGRSNRATLMENAAVKGATRTVTMNSAMAELLQSRIPNPPKIGLVPNAVDLSKFEGLPSWEDQEEKYDLGYIGSLVDYEGLDLLLHAVADLRKRGHIYTAKIVGRGHQLKPLKELSNELGLQDQVVFTGAVPADQVQSHFAQIRTIVLPRKSTPATECVTPLKPFEAMASKRALITSDVSALRELSRNGTASTVFENGNYVSLANAILNLSNNSGQRSSQLEEAFEMVRGYHSWDNIAKIMETELRANARSEYAFAPRVHQ
ncbi:glycosyltransferase family 4 protein [Corynebacteriaceae bacterium 6-324]